MNTLLQQMAGQATSCSNGASFTTPAPTTGAPVTGQMVLLDMFFPGFSTFSAFVQKNLNIDLNLYIPLVLICGVLTFVWQYFSTYCWDLIDSYMMSVVDVRTDDEIYNMLMGWVAAQKFAQGARRFVVNTNLNSRFWWLWRYDYEDEEENGSEEDSAAHSAKGGKKALAYTPTFGSHWFWYKGRLLCFRRSQSREMGFALPSEREEIAIKCFGRNPWILKELLLEARQVYMKRDEAKTLIYRGTTKGSGSEPTWQRCMARTSRPFSTVILNEKIKNELIDDVTDYLNPATRRWYANRGIPYRRGYLLHGPPGTGKSSLSLALAGFFNMRIYIVSLSSIAANEENLASLFSELPRRCVVLLEDIDTAGLTHTREGDKNVIVDSASDDMVPGQLTPGDGTTTGAAQPSSRLSLSGLLNILDGVASQEGRVLIMTTNHIEKLDKALIRPGRVDMIVEFGRADKEMTAAIFRAIFAPLEGDEVDTAPNSVSTPSPSSTTKNLSSSAAPMAEKEAAETQRQRRREELLARDEATLKAVNELATRFAEKIPTHEFSPAEIQGFLLKHKRNAAAAVEGAEQWAVEARREKVEKELKEAQEKRKKEKEAKEKEEARKKEEDEKKADKDKTEEEDKAEKKEKSGGKKSKSRSKRRSKHHKKSSRSRRSRRYSDSDDSLSYSESSSSSESEDESESEPEEVVMVKKEKKSSSKRKQSSKKKEPAIPPPPPPTLLVKEDTIKIVVADEVPSVITTMGPETDENHVVAVEEGIKGLVDVLPQISVTEVKNVGSTGSEDGKDSGYGTP